MDDHKPLRKSLNDPEMVPNFFEYCDHWCERCPLSNRCRWFAWKQSCSLVDPGAQDFATEKYWYRHYEMLREMLERVLADAKERGIPLNDPGLRVEIGLLEQGGRLRGGKNRLLTDAARTYAKAVDQWVNDARALFNGKLAELSTQEQLEIGEPGAERDRISDFLEVLQWYQHFIFVKLAQAIHSHAGAELATGGDETSVPKHWEGTVKVALIAMDRSISAWAGLLEALGNEADDILDLLAQLATLRRQTEAIFPEARAFVRPGFDAPAGTPAESTPATNKSPHP